ncbi:hypothetical protein A3B60_01825 [Candidatus Peregrinibacteria bacterium RIFCSPLOWO2_01_FULL_39_12]|nr:MAG: hypothetical protein A3B60_01825 [Candidatus Peregrinibacteria bacterium RIFCSPLOWO2_01_FULL_39_12]OGJ43498.1 MAG: hypothetical protein A3I58_02540 [Candidatus Peregrinibacteria bacterium RIFCSPLOWO2_02_FULL_39_10]
MGRVLCEHGLNMCLDEVVEGESLEEEERRKTLSGKIQLLRRSTQERVEKGGRRSRMEIFRGNLKKSRKELGLSLAGLTEELRVVEENRPRNRKDCVKGNRPCPWAGCKYHLYLDVNPDTGSIRYNFPGFDVDELPVSCALDVADVGSMDGNVVGYLLNVSREAVRVTLESAVRKMIVSLREV